MTATCTVCIRGRKPVTRTFSKEKAVKAGLWNKEGPWRLYPDRMISMRARSFGLRDAAPDILKGISCYEEMEDVVRVERDITPPQPVLKLVEEASYISRFIDIANEEQITTLLNYFKLSS